NALWIQPNRKSQPAARGAACSPTKSGLHEKKETGSKGHEIRRKKRKTTTYAAVFPLRSASPGAGQILCRMRTIPARCLPRSQAPAGAGGGKRRAQPRSSSTAGALVASRPEPCACEPHVRHVLLPSRH